MKPTVTWVILANARAIRVLAHRGPGRGLVALGGHFWRAQGAEPARDKAGIGHSIAGPGVAAVDQGDEGRKIETKFARNVVDHLEDDFRAKKFDRLIVASGPLMLGVLRGCLDGPLAKVIVGEIPKDLSTQSLSNVETHLGELIAV